MLFLERWVDVIFGENTSRSLDNLRLCEMSAYHKNAMQYPNKNSLKSASPFNAFLISSSLSGYQIYIDGCRKEVKKGVMLSHFCYCPSGNFCKSQARKRKKNKVHVMLKLEEYLIIIFVKQLTHMNFVIF